MKNWQITGFLTFLIIGTVLMSGCTNTGSTSTAPVAVSTPTPQIVYVTVLVTLTSTIPPVVTTIQTETNESILTQLNSKWREIRVVYDTFNENKNKLDLKSDNGINELRETNVPHTISEYERIKNELSQITINNYDLDNERKILVSICDYKIKFLQGMSSAYHALQTETFSPSTSLAEYKSAKYLFQDVRDIISLIPIIKLTETNYLKDSTVVTFLYSKYWEYVDADDQAAKSHILSADQGILRMSKIVK